MDPSMAHAVAVIGAALAVMGGAIGIGIIGYKAMDAIARQPAEAKNIRSNMILMAALIEGLAFFVAIIAILAIFTK